MEFQDKVYYDGRQLHYVASDVPLIDVRSPSEFATGHIVGAVNMPLFSDEERAEVGTLYKQVSPEAAMLKGLDFVGPKMSHMILTAKSLSPNLKVMVHCWRGGKRSESVAWLLRQGGLEADVVRGGYKAFRQGILNYYTSVDPFFVVIGGATGSGKTEILHELARFGEQIIDLEGLACHRGSAFGALGQDAQPNNEQFENELFNSFARLDLSRPIYIENESRMIGSCYIPTSFYDMVFKNKMIEIQLTDEVRVERLVADYGGFTTEELALSFKKITSKLGTERLKKAITHVENNEMAEAAAIALQFYDKAYAHWKTKNPHPNTKILSFAHFDAQHIAQTIIKSGNK